MGWFLADYTCTSSKTEILSKIGIQILILNFQIKLERFFTKKTCKVKMINHDLNHNLIFYCTHNQSCVPQQIVSVQSMGFFGWYTPALSSYFFRLKKFPMVVHIKYIFQTLSKKAKLLSFTKFYYPSYIYLYSYFLTIFLGK